MSNEVSYGLTITDLVKQAYGTAVSKGWHDKERANTEVLCLIHGEVSEAMEADRRNEGEDRYWEELADVVIRILDHAGERGADLESAIIKKMEYNKTRSYKHGNKKF